jgi:hypothetical protein
MQTNAVDFDKPAGRRVVAFGLLSALAIEEPQGSQSADASGGCNGQRL